MIKALSIASMLVLLFACSSAENKSQTTLTESNTDTIKPIEDIYSINPEDSVVFDSIMILARQLNLNQKSLANVEIAIANMLLNIPYVAHTLEINNKEELVINLQGLDCTTFLENVVSLSKCIKAGDTSLVNYCKQLQQFRYRNGVIDKYPSRLHYFTDWLIDNEKKGLITIVSNEFGNADFDSGVGFMSKNADKYKHLKDNPEFVKQIAEQENAIAKAKLKYVTKDQIDALANKIKDGDLIAFTTTINGLDIAHVAIAAFKGDKLHFYHASSAKKKVVLSEKTISGYLAGMKKNEGIIVARLVE